MNKKITIYDIAAETNLSWSTVGAILNGTWRSRRISENTATLVLDLAEKRGYTANLMASGLRRSRSGLVGMILPMLDNRFFSSLAQSFETATREFERYPVVVSTQRDPEMEQETVRALLSHKVDALVIAGATDPDNLSDMCSAAGVRHVNVDLPGSKATSVLSDNVGGATILTQAILAETKKKRGELQGTRLCFIGGVPSDHNTRERIKGFRLAAKQTAIPENAMFVRPIGYGADETEAELRQIYHELGGLPEGIFVNSTISFEGAVRFLRTLPLPEVSKCTIGCFDWDPYIELLHFPVFMIRQNVDLLIAETYKSLGTLSGVTKQPTSTVKTVLVPTEFIDYRILL